MVCPNKDTCNRYMPVIVVKGEESCIYLSNRDQECVFMETITLQEDDGEE